MSPIVIIVVFRVFLGGYSFALAIFGLYKLGLFIKIQGSHFNIPQVCLGIEIIGNLCKYNIIINRWKCLTVEF
jgi:thiol:disulfide interchange protein